MKLINMIQGVGKHAIAFALVASFLITNVAAIGATADNKKTAAHSSASAKYTTDLTQLGREGRLREDSSYDSETARLIKVLAQGERRQPVILDENKAFAQTVVEQAALRITRGQVPAALSGRSIVKVETEALFSNART